MDATWLTAVRTGAAGAVASKYLAVSRPRTIGFVGAGVQARVLLAAHRVANPDLQVRVADATAETAAHFAAELGAEVTTLENACACDIVCTTTPVREPIVRADWIAPGTHVNAIGADGPGKQEMESSLLRRAKVVVDDLEQASHSGEINVPFHQGVLDASSIHGTLGEVVAGIRSGREGEEISIFDSTGLAVQDVAVAKLVYERALQSGRGTRVDFRK
jgi:ornithine cyclodeaminase/alanine dehydrogenase